VSALAGRNFFPPVPPVWRRREIGTHSTTAKPYVVGLKRGDLLSGGARHCHERANSHGFQIAQLFDHSDFYPPSMGFGNPKIQAHKAGRAGLADRKRPAPNFAIVPVRVKKPIPSPEAGALVWPKKPLSALDCRLGLRVAHTDGVAWRLEALPPLRPTPAVALFLAPASSSAKGEGGI
jgi:hypothetical protein